MSLFITELTHFDKNFHLLNTFNRLPLPALTWQNLQSGWLYALMWAWIFYELLLCYSLSVFLSVSVPSIIFLNISCSFLHLFQYCSSHSCFAWEASHFFVLTTRGLFFAFQCSFHRTLTYVKLLTYFSLKTYTQQFTGENNLLLILFLEALYVFVMQWSCSLSLHPGT